MRSMMEGVCGIEASRVAGAPSTALLHRTVPLPRFARQDEAAQTRIGIST
jgi:hypothetical protein